jgi:hypothetical protein
MVFATNYGEIDVDYLMPEAEAPWPNARIKGVATSIEDALSLVQIAMDRCGGWSKSGL